MISLQMVATRNACSHLLFPFQFFDLAFLYAFFSIRTATSPPTLSWVVQQLLLQINIVLRNSGYAHALVRLYIAPVLVPLIGGAVAHGLTERDPYEDPLFTLQYLARLAVQYDLADITALLTVHSVVSIFVWRDGFFSMQGTSIIIRPCDLPYVWMRCGLLMMIKPAASSVARAILKRKMRKTLIGKKTIHGVSAIVSKQLQRQKIAKVGSTRRARQDARAGSGAAGHLAADAKMELVEEELVGMRSRRHLPSPISHLPSPPYVHASDRSSSGRSSQHCVTS